MLSRVNVHHMTITGDARFVQRIRDEIREQHAAIVTDDSWTITDAGGVLEFNTTDILMIMRTPLVVLTDVQVDAAHVSGSPGVESPTFEVPPIRLGDLRSAETT